MKQYSLKDFESNPAYLIFRLDIKMAQVFLDIYMLMHLPSSYILGQEIIEHELTKQHIDALLTLIPEKNARVLLAKNDPADLFLKTSSQQRGFTVEMVPLPSINSLLTHVKQTFSSQFMTTLGQDFSDPDDASAAALIPDSYESCPCASGKQYKACCKNIFVEITCAMTAAEDGNYIDALSWIEKARSIVGTTPEIICRESIVYSFFDEKKSNTLLETCLKQHPNYPRAHYIYGICLTEQGDLTGAIEAYKAAIRLYPETDHYHLNEAYNNMGIIYYNMNDRENAALAWQKAVVYMPSDSMARENLALVQGYGAKRG